MSDMEWAAFAACSGEDPEAWFPSGEDEDWRDLALCAEADPEAWFPETGHNARAAKAICRRCDVREDCLAYALEHRIRWGIWGGLSEKERQALGRQREAA
jgi:WhiB family redox-sensing transcriptional regulator